MSDKKAVLNYEKLISRSAWRGDCLEYMGVRVRGGYGCFKKRPAHRVAWEFANGRTIPPGMVIMHSCDNPPCVNPAHLQVGTYKQNSQDMVAKRRGGVGSTNGNSKLTEADIRLIRGVLVLRPHLLLSLLARAYGVTTSAIRYIRSSSSWRDVPVATEAEVDAFLNSHNLAKHIPLSVHDGLQCPYCSFLANDMNTYRAHFCAKHGTNPNES